MLLEQRITRKGIIVNKNAITTPWQFFFGTKRSKKHCSHCNRIITQMAIDSSLGNFYWNNIICIIFNSNSSKSNHSDTLDNHYAPSTKVQYNPYEKHVQHQKTKSFLLFRYSAQAKVIIPTHWTITMLHQPRYNTIRMKSTCNIRKQSHFYSSAIQLKQK